jgi:hypothetical protein
MALFPCFLRETAVVEAAEDDSQLAVTVAAAMKETLPSPQLWALRAECCLLLHLRLAARQGRSFTPALRQLQLGVHPLPPSACLKVEDQAGENGEPESESNTKLEIEDVDALDFDSESDRVFMSAEGIQKVLDHVSHVSWYATAITLDQLLFTLPSFSLCVSITQYAVYVVVLR